MKEPKILHEIRKRVKEFRVLIIVRVTRKCGHETDYPMKTKLSALRRMAKTACAECREANP